MLPLGVPFHVVVAVFRRMMRLRRYMLQSVHVRMVAVDRLTALRRACEFRTRNTVRWGKCVDVGGYVECFVVRVCCLPLCSFNVLF
jgi:hypothetical protein